LMFEESYVFLGFFLLAFFTMVVGLFVSVFVRSLE